jgi:hypothetical protein
VAASPGQLSSAVTDRGRTRVLQLWAVGQGVAYPAFGLTGLLDDADAALPPGIEATYPSPDRAGVLDAALATATLLYQAGHHAGRTWTPRCATSSPHTAAPRRLTNGRVATMRTPASLTMRPPQTRRHPFDALSSARSCARLLTMQSRSVICDLRLILTGAAWTWIGGFSFLGRSLAGVAGGEVDVVAAGGVGVGAAGWSAGSWSGGFRCGRRGRGLRAQVPKPSTYPGW